jgi:hypothetical protein
MVYHALPSISETKLLLHLEEWSKMKKTTKKISLTIFESAEKITIILYDTATA